MTRHGTVLVVDDDALFRQLAHDALIAAGFDVQEAVDGPDGLAKAEAIQPDVILLDVLMPGIDGYETCQGLRANPLTAKIPVIMATVSKELSVNRLAYAAGAVACLPKPMRWEGLLAVIHTAMDGATRGVH